MTQIVTLATPPAPSNETSHYERRIVHSMRQLMQSMDVYSRQLIKKYDITVPQAACLYELSEKGAMTQAILAKNIHLSASTTVGIIDRLEEKGFIKRTRAVDDRRAIFVDITPKGREFVATSPHLLHNHLHDALASLPESEQVIIANALDMLVHLLAEHKA